MNDDIKKVLESVPFGYKADHAQLWMHLRILAEYIKSEPTRTKTANEAAIMEWRAGAADRNELRADYERRIAELETQLANAKEHLDEFSSFPTLAEGIQAMRIRMLELHAENIRLSAPCPTCGSSLFDCADCVEKQKADLSAQIKALSFCEHGVEVEHLTNCEKCVNFAMNKL